MTNYKENICANIAYLRKTHNLSRTRMSKTLHIATKTLDLLEHGIFPPRLDFGIVYCAASVFGVEPYHIMYSLLKETAVLA